MKAVYANTHWKRLVGMLLGRGANPGECLVLSCCNDVHTCGMKWPLDLAFVDKEGRVLMIRRNLRPWRRVLCKNAYAAIERVACADAWFELGDIVPWAVADAGKRERKRK